MASRSSANDERHDFFFPLPSFVLVRQRGGKPAACTFFSFPYQRRQAAQYVCVCVCVWEKDLRHFCLNPGIATENKQPFEFLRHFGACTWGNSSRRVQVSQTSNANFSLFDQQRKSSFFFFLPSVASALLAVPSAALWYIYPIAVDSPWRRCLTYSCCVPSAMPTLFPPISSPYCIFFRRLTFGLRRGSLTNRQTTQRPVRLV